MRHVDTRALPTPLDKRVQPASNGACTLLLTAGGCLCSPCASAVPPLCHRRLCVGDQVSRGEGSRSTRDTASGSIPLSPSRPSAAARTGAGSSESRQRRDAEARSCFPPREGGPRRGRGGPGAGGVPGLGWRRGATSRRREGRPRRGGPGVPPLPASGCRAKSPGRGQGDPAVLDCPLRRLPGEPPVFCVLFPSSPRTHTPIGIFSSGLFCQGNFTGAARPPCPELPPLGILKRRSFASGESEAKRREGLRGERGTGDLTDIQPCTVGLPSRLPWRVPATGMKNYSYNNRAHLNTEQFL